MILGGTPERAARNRQIAAIALPIMGSMASQNVLNLVDTWMVGRLGDAALAAVSSASFVNFACIALIMGLSASVQAVAARRVGEGKPEMSARPLHEGLLLAFLLGFPAMFALMALAQPIYALINPDPVVGAQAVPYLQARLAAMVAVGMNYAFRGFWNGIGRSQIYMHTLIIMHTINVVLSWCLIFGKWGFPELGSLGAGVGTAISTWIGTAIYGFLAWRHARPHGFLSTAPTTATMASLVRLSVPTSAQQFLFALGYNVLFAIIATMGQTEVAAAGVLLNVALVAVLPGLALGMTASTLVSQALGRNEPDDAARWGWDVVRVGLVVLTILGLPMALTPDWLLQPFLPGRPETIALASPALQLIGAFMAFDAIGMVLMNSLLGAGAARYAATWSIGFQWLFFLPLAYVAGPVLGGSLFAIWGVHAVHRALQAVVFARAWSQGWWKSIRI